MYNQEWENEIKPKLDKFMSKPSFYHKSITRGFMRLGNVISNNNCEICNSYLPYLREYAKSLEKQENNTTDEAEKETKKIIHVTLNKFISLDRHLMLVHGFGSGVIYRFCALIINFIIIGEAFYHKRNLFLVFLLSLLVFLIGRYFDKRNIEKGNTI
jgi:thiol-disulfide isomerase/thioredoxin